MVSIDPLQAALHASSQLQSPQQKTKKTDKSKKKGLFSTLLADSAKEEASLSSLPPDLANLSFDEAMQVLIDSVYEAGDILKKKPYADSFVIYKKAIGEFLRFVVDESYEVEDQEGVAQKNKAGIFIKKKYTIVKTVNEELDRLAKDILYNQIEQMQLVARVDGITGLLLNTFS